MRETVTNSLIEKEKMENMFAVWVCKEEGGEMNDSPEQLVLRVQN